MIISSVVGLLMLDPAQESELAKPDYLDALILQSDRHHYQRAREFYRFITSGWFAHAADVIEADADLEARREAFKTASRAVKGDPRWTAVILVLGLVFANRSHKSVTVDEMRDCLRSAEEQGLNLWHLVQAEIEQEN